MTFHPLTPDQLARMSWRQRAQYDKHLWAWIADQQVQIEARKAMTTRALAPEVHEAMQKVIGLIDGALTVERAAKKAAVRRKGGSLTPEGRQAVMANLNKARSAWQQEREKLRAEAERLFTAGRQPYVVSDRLGVPIDTVRRWRREWRHEAAA